MPIGLTPGSLSRGISLHATKALRWSGLILSVHKRLPILARAELRSLEDLKELQSLLQACASRPDRPAAPLVFKAAFRIASALRFSKRIGFTGVGRLCNKQFIGAGFPGGCFPTRISRVVRDESGLEESGITSSRPRTPPGEEDESNLRALFTFPVDISL